ncbi:MAG: hypothetical protein D6160_01975 [Ketobacter sp.]|nr:MAG: hypothetical protein D6160_01975 [Ketobacter sp.]
MELDKISVQVRPRNPYEAIDLGCVMARQWYLPMLALWLAWALPVMGISYLIFYDQPWWALLLVWWLKPLFESLQLHYISEKLFNDDLSWKAVLPRSHKILFRNLFSKLITRRLAFARSFDMPVGELEGLKSTSRRKRLNTMHRDGNAAGFWLTMIGNGIETTFVLAVFSVAWLFIPMQMSIDFELQKLLDSALLFPVITASGFLAMTLVSPFYVTAGFMLYINRRTWLEAWDVELSFRQLASKHQALTGTVSVILALLIMVSLAATPTPGYANNVDVVNDPELSRNQIIEILEGEDYQNWQSEQAWCFKKADQEDDSSHWYDDALENFIDWLRGLKDRSTPPGDHAAIILMLLEGLLWIALAAFIGYLIYRYRHIIVPRFDPLASPAAQPTGKIFGLELSKNAFDGKVIETASDYWQQGQRREALSHMYRAALSYLVYERKLRLQSSQTEQECMRLCMVTEPEFRSRYFSTLTRHWINLAYAHQVLSDDDFFRLCEQWDQFSTPGQGVHHD